MKKVGFKVREGSKSGKAIDNHVMVGPPQYVEDYAKSNHRYHAQAAYLTCGGDTKVFRVDAQVL